MHVAVVLEFTQDSECYRQVLGVISDANREYAFYTTAMKITHSCYVLLAVGIT